jgi:hypothetical protein
VYVLFIMHVAEDEADLVRLQWDELNKMHWYIRHTYGVEDR